MMRIQQLFILTSVLTIVGIFPGCASIKTRQLFRSADGLYSAHCSPRATRGVPCKFRIETGVRAEIVETFFVDPKSGQVITPQEQRIYSLKTTPIKTDQNFVVHIPRPLAGTLDLMGNSKGYHFTEEGYLKTIGAEIEDKTVDDITSVLGNNSLGGLLKRTSAGDPEISVNGLEAQTRVIALKEFSYGNCDWHTEMNDWINQFEHCLNQCSGTCFQNNPTIIE